eukprot:TRINITY_DN6049_c0_g1_i1.p3 TRINITY_DN6049_c0_g1~~TRINITY_DN6049_c0_g1_i1.p3  ORF type:complete len:157 (+),score=3.56 TRINITY_DN6049_c0_g1_i1:590-1060(+)
MQSQQKQTSKPFKTHKQADISLKQTNFFFIDYPPFLNIILSLKDFAVFRFQNQIHKQSHYHQTYNYNGGKRQICMSFIKPLLNGQKSKCTKARKWVECMQNLQPKKQLMVQKEKTAKGKETYEKRQIFNFAFLLKMQYNTTAYLTFYSPQDNIKQP